jgi:trimethylamine:corrinoid methyltransferase-like protein
VRQLLREKHLLTAPHTLRYWPQELHLPGSVFDRLSRETWLQEGGKSLEQRVNAEVERRLAAYVSPPIERQADAEMVRLITEGMTSGQTLPETLPPAESSGAEQEPQRPGRRSRRPRPT